VRCRLIALPLIALSLLTAVTVPAGSAVGAALNRAMVSPGGIGIGLLGQPGRPPDGPLARVYVIERLVPGKSLRRRVEVINTSGAAAEIAVYVAAARMARGSFTYAAGHSQNELSSWTTLSRRLVRLAPGADAFAALTIDVPGNASSGWRYAVVWAQVSTMSSVDGGVKLVNRVGLRMYVSVGPVLAPQSNFAIGALTAERVRSGQPRISAGVHNTGRTTLDITGNLTLSKGPGGLRTAPLPAQLATRLAPGRSELVTVTFGAEFPRGPWSAHLVLTSGLVQRAVEARITFPRVAGASATLPGTSPLAFVAIALACLLALAVVGLLVPRCRTSARHRRHSGPAR
jgi:hypothetical protein